MTMTVWPQLMHRAKAKSRDSLTRWHCPVYPTCVQRHHCLNRAARRARRHQCPSACLCDLFPRSPACCTRSPFATIASLQLLEIFVEQLSRTTLTGSPSVRYQPLQQPLTLYLTAFAQMTLSLRLKAIVWNVRLLLRSRFGW